MGADPDHSFIPYAQTCFRRNHKNQVYTLLVTHLLSFSARFVTYICSLQFFSYTSKGEVRNEYSCLEVVYPTDQDASLKMIQCQEKPTLLQQWRHERVITVLFLLMPLESSIKAFSNAWYGLLFAPEWWVYSEHWNREMP